MRTMTRLPGATTTCRISGGARDEMADASPCLGNADVAKQLHRFAYRVAAHFVPFRQLRLGWQGRAGRETPDDDRAPEVDRQLEIGRQHALRVDDGDVDDVAYAVDCPLVIGGEVMFITLCHLCLPLG